MQLLNTISNNRIVNKHGLKFAWALAAACFLLLVWHVALTLKTQNQVKAANYSVKPVLTTRPDARPQYRVQDIVRANLFGNPNPRPVVRKAPKTTLDLTLQGILWATDNSMARAIISSGKKSSKLYSVGESIQGAGASVKEIRDGEVILNRNGASESLPLIKKTSSGNRQLITYRSEVPQADDMASTVPVRTDATASPASITRSSPKPRSRNGKNRKIRKPNFSGLDKALEKKGEI